MLIKNRDITKTSVFNKNISFFPHPCLVRLLIIFGTVDVFSLAPNCARTSFPKGIIDQSTMGAFASPFLFHQ